MSGRGSANQFAAHMRGSPASLHAFVHTPPSDPVPARCQPGPRTLLVPLSRDGDMALRSEARRQERQGPAQAHKGAPPGRGGAGDRQAGRRTAGRRACSATARRAP